MVSGARFGLQLRTAGGRRWRWDGALADAAGAAGRQLESPHGPLETFTLQFVPRAPAWSGPVRVTAEFALPVRQPFLLWRLRVENAGAEDLQLHTLELAVIGSRFGISLPTPEARPASHLHLSAAPGPLAFFSNGYQSWSFTGALQASMRLPPSRFAWLEGPKMLNLRNPVVNSLGHFTSDMFAVLGDVDHDAGLVLGCLTQREQFGHVEALVLEARAPYLRLAADADDVRLAPGAARVSDWAYLEFMRPQALDPLGTYIAAVARANAARVPAHTPVGWCSWYHYFDRVTARDVAANLEAAAALRPRLPLDFIQIDDGFQAQVGDWFETKPTFPHGLTGLAGAIRARGCTPGLWLAPYIVRSDARLNDQHPEWFLRDARGRRVNAGFNWLRWCYALDPTHPGVREHVQRLIATAVREWGFPYLKLDFLYAAALPGRRFDPALTRAQAMRLALDDMRVGAGPETFLLGCGCPLGSAVGVVDGMRISTDVAPSWDPELFTPALGRWVRSELGFVSARNAIHNIISRAPLHRRWWLNDPDCLLVRDEATRLTEAEVRCLATVIALSGGMFLVSDDLARLKPERYRYAAALLPMLDLAEPPRVPGWLTERTPELMTRALSGPAGVWQVAGVFNWADHPHTRTLALEALGLPPADYWVANFWEGTVTRLAAGAPLSFPDMPAHSAQLVAVRAVTAEPALAASSFHYSQGGEVRAWTVAGDTLTFTLELGRVAEGTLHLALPRPPRQVLVDNRVTPATPAGDGLYAIAFTVTQSVTISVMW